MRHHLDPDRVQAFGAKLAQHPSRRVNSASLWKAFAFAFPSRPQGPEEGEWLVEALQELEAKGVLKLPSLNGDRWDRATAVAIPKAVDLVAPAKEAQSKAWKTFPWHPRLSWVGDLRHLSFEQETFLHKVHDGLVHETFSKFAPMKYRSLQLTGDEKKLSVMAKSCLFQKGRLDLELLGCLKEIPPIAIDRVGGSQSLILFENQASFWVAREVLRSMPNPPYGLVGYGAGERLPAAVRYLSVLEPRIEKIDYVGDLDIPGLEIANQALVATQQLQLPSLKAAPGMHAAMLRAAKAFGHPNGWPVKNHGPLSNRSLLAFLPLDIQGSAREILEGRKRIPEEVLGPDEMAEVWISISAV